MKFKHLVAIIGLSFAASIHAADMKELRVGQDPTYEPFEYKTPDGKLIRFEVDIANALCAEMKMRCVFVDSSWEGIIPSLMAKKYDVILSSMSMTDERKKVVAFTDKYYNTPSRIIVKRGSGIVLDLYVCLRPVRWFTGVPSPVKHPEKVDMVIFRENTEDIYAGLEVEEGTPEAAKLIALLHDNFGWDIRPDSGIGIKPISETGSKRLIRAAIEYAVTKKRSSVTMVHKGNIQKFTEGAFRNWGYELVREEFADVAVGWDDCGGDPGGKILVKDAIADITLQQVLTRPDEFDVIATTNLNGDYLSDALAAQVGGIGIAPGGNINYVTGHGIFEATHGTAPKYAGQDKVNPGSLLLSGVMMFEHLGWEDAADSIVRALEATIGEKIVTYDFARLMDGATEVKTSEFAQAIVDRL